jgi:hypothetical protein
VTEEEKRETQSREEWLTEERRRLEEGFTFEPQTAPEGVKPSPADDILAQLGLGAGALAGVVAGHDNPVTFEGCRASTVANALVSEIADGDTRATISETQEATIVRVLQRQEPQLRYSPALTVTLIETDESLTIAMSDLSPDVKRGSIGSISRSALQGGRRLLLRRRGLPGMLDAAGGLIAGIEDVAEDIQDLSLPRRVWLVIDRVCLAAEETYLEERRKKQALERERQAAERAWTHCEWCGRAYAEEEAGVVQCPSCGAARGSKPEWFE